MRWGANIVVLLALASSLAACGGSDSTITPTSDKYEQTWATPYSETTCADFKTAMSAKQRWVMAADMLVSARKADGATDMPADSMVTEFMGGMDTACVVSTMTTGETAAGLYVTERARFQPTP